MILLFLCTSSGIANWGTKWIWRNSFFGFLSWVVIEVRFWVSVQQLVQCVCCSLCIKHPNLFGGSEMLDVSWDKGLYDSNILVAYRRPRPQWVSQQCFVVQVCSWSCSVVIVLAFCGWERNKGYNLHHSLDCFNFFLTKPNCEVGVWI